MRGAGFVTSALLVFGCDLWAQPAIIQNPESRTALYGSSVLFQVAATGGTPLQYQWQFNGQDIPGARARVLKLTASPSRAGIYSVRVRDEAGEDVSAPAELEVVRRPGFLLQPRDVVVGEHATAVFTTVLNDSAPYRRLIWHNDNPLEGPHEIPPSTGLVVDEPSLTIPNCLNTDSYNGVYWLAATNGAAGISSRKARLTVVGPPVLSTQPLDRIARIGSSASFTVKAAPSPEPPESYQWFKEGRPIEGATTKKLVLRRVQPGDAGNYYCVVTGLGGKTASWGAQLTVIDPQAQ